MADAVMGPTAPSYGTPGPVGSVRYFQVEEVVIEYQTDVDPTASPAGGGGSGAVLIQIRCNAISRRSRNN